MVALFDDLHSASRSWAPLFLRASATHRRCESSSRDHAIAPGQDLLGRTSRWRGSTEDTREDFPPAWSPSRPATLRRDQSVPASAAQGPKCAAFASAVPPGPHCGTTGWVPSQPHTDSVFAAAQAESSAHTPVVAEQSPTAKKHAPPPGHAAPGVEHVTSASSAASGDASFCPTAEVEHAVSMPSAATLENIIFAAIMCAHLS